MVSEMLTILFFFFKRKDAEFFYEHGIHKRNESFRQFRAFRVQKSTLRLRV